MADRESDGIAPDSETSSTETATPAPEGTSVSGKAAALAKVGAAVFVFPTSILMRGFVKGVPFA